MTKDKEISMDEKLNLLLDLQSIDSQIDKIHTLKGELPLEVKDLEDEIEGLNTRLSNFEKDVEALNVEISRHKNNIVEATTLIAKYTKQQDNVKNNREFDALTKEIELQKLEVQLSEKRSKENVVKLDAKKEAIDDTNKKIADKEKALKAKNKELDKIITETDKEEKDLQKKSDSASKKIEERLLVAYSRIRKAYRNGLAVVSVERDACGGCFAQVPPQLQMEIRQRKKIILCEHCGRILVAPNIAEFA
ncbi:MAG: C4-type zinc ribbon domain-containing protein [Bacteroidota bacterium]